MAPPPDRIYDVCADLLGAIIDRHGGELPDRAYVSAMAPPMDCELVATWCERTYSHTGNVVEEVIEPHRSQASHVLRAGMFVVTMYRCTPAVPDDVGDQIVLPSTDEEQTAARTLYTDAQRMQNALRAAERAGELAECNGLAFDSWTGLGPEGGMVGGELRVRVGLSTGL